MTSLECTYYSGSDGLTDLFTHTVDAEPCKRVSHVERERERYVRTEIRAQDTRFSLS